MALDERYIVGINIGEYFVDKATGLPLSGGTIEFWKDNSRSDPKLVYELTGSPPNYTYTALPDPITLSSVGTIVNASGVNVAVYYYPFDEFGNIELYYIVVRNSDGVEQLIREAWPNITAAEDPTRTENSISNALSNSQFVDVLFEPSYGLTLSFDTAVSNQEYQIAPDWFIRVSSNAAGSILVNRTALAGSLNITTNPPYRLEITPEGGSISSLKLIQRLSHNPDIWSNGFIAGTLVATSLDDINHTIEMLYAPSVSPSATTIFTGITGTSGYVQLSGTIELDAGANTEDADIGYVDIQIVLPVTGGIALTSVQLVGLETDQQDVIYDQEPVNRQEDHLFHYYNPKLQYKPTSGFLQGWNFPLNPTQFGTSGSLGSIGANKSAYIWDQTILHQSTNNSLNYARNSGLAAGFLNIVSTNTTQPAIIQYLSGNDLNALLHARELSAYIKLLYSGTQPTGTISLWYTTDSTLPNVAAGTNNSIVLTLDANGKPLLLNGNWTEIPRSDLGDARFLVDSTSTAAPSEFGFSGWVLPSGYPNGATYFAIVVGFSSIATSSSIIIGDVNLVAGSIPSPSADLSKELTLAQLQPYYEKSLSSGVAAGTNTTIGEVRKNLFVYLNSGIDDNDRATSVPVSFYYPWRIQKRTTPNVSIYAPSGVVDEVEVYMTINGTTSGLTTTFPVAGTNPYNAALATYWTVSADLMGYYFTMINSHTVSDEGIMQVERSPAAQFLVGEAEGFINYQFSADARLGIVL